MSAFRLPGTLLSWNTWKTILLEWQERTAQAEALNVSPGASYRNRLPGPCSWELLEMTCIVRGQGRERANLFGNHCSFIFYLFPQEASAIWSPMFGFSKGLQASFSTSHSPISANTHILFFWFICFKKSLCIFKVTTCYLVSKPCPQLRADFTRVSYSNLGKVWEILFAPVLHFQNHSIFQQVLECLLCAVR